MLAGDGDLASLASRLALFWLAAHCVRFLLRRAAARAHLPAPSSHRSRAPGAITAGSVTITLRNAHLSVHSTALNALHDSLARALSRPRARRVLGAFYDLGSVLGAVGMAGSLVLLFWTAAQLTSGLFFDAARVPVDHLDPAPAQMHHKRGFGTDIPDGLDAAQSAGTSIPLNVIIPGVTVPLSHTPLLLGALLLSQLIHEAGHAITAAMESVPLLSAGVSLTVAFPSAFVALPAGAAHALGAPARLRLASAGAFHNLLLWLALAALAQLRAGRALWPALGYQDVAGFGRVVTGVAEDSPLHGYLLAGALVLKLDDLPLTHADPAADIWSEYLSGPAAHPPAKSLGWCVDRPWFEGQPRSCCLSGASGPRSLACFESYAQPPEDRCVDPVPILADHLSAADTTRCSSALDCGGGTLCVRPRADQALLRLTFRPPPSRAGDVPHAPEQSVIWNGPRGEVLEDVAVSTWLPRYSLLPLGMPPVVDAFFAYLRMITLSLYFLNLLPLPALDGAQFLDALLDWMRAPSDMAAGHGDEINLETMEGGLESTANTRHRGTLTVQWKSKTQRAVQITSISLVGTCILLGIMRILR